ncbi:hypothetical protein BJ986_000082 [Phycicoccus badiiscoriae]|uniref:Uncharacterized protein n=1 Tax=Pedococcus badiiscoriae TaxID=642776 RepID=A0A852WH49_9MICO|nr:hypothetical protein [Pedococcus badiiscoriae]NYG05595.1 hypothetical protein [Pedococcus badiiscoriae]
MADDERPAVGTVAQEAARLLDALGGWASTTQAGYAAAAGGRWTAPTAGDPDSETVGDPLAGPQDSHGHGHGHGHGLGSGGPGPRCESCGAENGAGQAVTCQLCPVCQGIGLLRSVRPETVDRLADLAGALAATLRDIAGQRRADSGSDGRSDSRSESRADKGATASGGASGTARGRVHDIVVDDENEPTAQPGSATS